MLEQKKNSTESNTKLPSFDETISSIYFIANSPMGLYLLMRESPFVSEVLASYPAEVLVEEFENRVNSPIKESSEIAEVYAILVALTFKDKIEVEHFFKKVTEFKFEWFSQIAQFYLRDKTVIPNIQSVEIDSKIRIDQSVRSTESDFSYTLDEV